MRPWLVVAIGTLITAHAAAAAQPIDCSTPIAKAQKSIDKVTGDLEGMEQMMAKNELGRIHGLVSEAEKLLEEARQDCARKTGPYDQARSIARAKAADGYAVAADVLHFHYMETMSSGDMKQMPAASGAATPAGMTKMQNVNGTSDRK